jgi:hypothetical protein
MKEKFVKQLVWSETFVKEDISDKSTQLIFTIILILL